jgi:hypothetical protein
MKHALDGELRQESYSLSIFRADEPDVALQAPSHNRKKMFSDICRLDVGSTVTLTFLYYVVSFHDCLLLRVENYLFLSSDDKFW